MIKKIRIPVVFDDYRLKKSDNSLLLIFSVPEGQIDLAKPLLNHINQSFILSLQKTTDEDIEVDFREVSK